ncbi:MAG: hypothetical protein O2954_07035, partial [bacterium]|nr:hypothetical protein [bacterium]
MENKNTPSAFELAETWLNSPVGRIPLLPEEMERLRVRVKTDEITRTAWADTCAVVDEFLGEKPGPLIPTPLAEYYSNPEATRNNNRAARFWSGWTACAWKAAVVNDQPALDRATTCL